MGPEPGASDRTADAATGGGRIVVGVDGSAPSAQALRWAARIAPAIGASIDAVVAWHLPVNVDWGYAADSWNPEADAITCLRGAVEAVFGTDRPSGVRLLVREGLPAKVLLEASDTASMLIVGSRGHGGFTGLLLGSVSSSCVEHASCPVLVVHGERPPRQRVDRSP